MPNRRDTGLPFAGLQSPLPKPTYIVQSQAEIGEADKKLQLPPSSFLFFISGFVCLFFSPKHSSISMAAIAAAVVFSPEKITHRMISSASLCSFSLSPKPLSNSRLSITKSHLQALPFQKVHTEKQKEEEKEDLLPLVSCVFSFLALRILVPRISGHPSCSGSLSSWFISYYCRIGNFSIGEEERWCFA